MRKLIEKIKAKFSRKPLLAIPVVSGSLHNPNVGIDNPIAKGEINTGGIGYKALDIKETVVIGDYAGFETNGEHNVVGDYAGFETNGEHNVVGDYAGFETNGEHNVVGDYAGNQDANGNDI